MGFGAIKQNFSGLFYVCITLKYSIIVFIKLKKNKWNKYLLHFNHFSIDNIYDTFNRPIIIAFTQGAWQGPSMYILVLAAFSVCFLVTGGTWHKGALVQWTPLGTALVTPLTDIHLCCYIVK